MVSTSTDISRFRQVELIGGAERYVGVSGELDSPFVGERDAETVTTRSVRYMSISGVSGRMAELADHGFIVTEQADSHRVQLTRFSTPDHEARCVRDSDERLSRDAALTDMVASASETPARSTIAGGTLTLAGTDEAFVQESECPTPE